MGTATKLTNGFHRTGHLAVVLWMLLAWSQPAAGMDGVEPIGISTQSLARGGADVAVGDSALSQIDNPATLTLSPRGDYRCDLSAQLLMPQSYWSGIVDSDDSRTKLIPLGNIGISIPLRDRLSLGLAAYSKSLLVSRYKLRHLAMPFKRRRVGVDFKDFDLSVNLAYKLTEQLSIGAGIRGEIATTKYRTVLETMEFEFGRQYGLGGGLQLGLHYQATPTLAFGLSYRSPTWFGDLSGGNAAASFSGNAQTSLSGFIPIPLGDAMIEEPVLPQKINAGLAWDATDWLKVVGEARWINYSNSSFHSLKTVTDFITDVHTRYPLRYHDQYVFIAGAEFKLDDRWKLGAGYHYCTNPISQSRFLPVAAAIIQHHITTGLRYEKDNWWIGAAYVLGLKSSMSGQQFSLSPFGTENKRSTIEQMEHSVCVGFGFSW